MSQCHMGESMEHDSATETASFKAVLCQNHQEPGAQPQKDVNLFLHTLPERDCDIFLRRYFFLENTAEIAKRYGMRDSNVLLILFRLRKKLKKYRRKEGYFV